MTSQATPVVKDLVLLGGGHAHVIVLKRLGMKPIPGVRVTLICRDVHTPYSGMLPGLVAGHYSYDEAHIDLRPLANFAGARLFHAEASGIDPEKRLVHFADRPPAAYDLLSINIGSTPGFDNVPGAREFAVPVKPIGNFLPRWQAFVERVLRAGERPRIAVVGAGAGGVELTLAIEHRLRRLLGDAGRAFQAEMHLFSRTAEILPTHAPRVRRKLLRLLHERSVEVHCGARVAEVLPNGLRTDSGWRQSFDEIVWVTGAAAPAWLASSGLAADADGFAAVDACLRSVSHGGSVFAAGDIAAVVDHEREKAGVFAVRQGPPLERNLRRALAGAPPRPFRPQKKFLSLIGAGDRYAVGSRGFWSVEGRWVWDWKERIDRRFMVKFSDLPAMRESAAALPAAAAGETPREFSAAPAMRCKGCGSKLGAGVLDRVLADIDPLPRPDVPAGMDSRDDAALVEVPAGKVQVQSVDYFPAIVEDPFVFGRIAANHALGDIFAMGAEPQSALALAGVPFAPPEKTEELLRQLLQGANRALREAGAALAGGHSSETPEMALGFSVSGLAERGKILSKGGLHAGDALILTKPIGTGTLFAADARRQAKGRWIEAALAAMLQSAGAAAEEFRRSRASACTDVTGFGFLGHLLEMLRASGKSAEIALPDVPLLDGAASCAAAGIFSSLHPENLVFGQEIANAEQFAGDPRQALLFDPQTAGGLLAGTPQDEARACLEALRRRGYAQAAIVGRVTDGGEGGGLVTLRAGGP